MKKGEQEDEGRWESERKGGMSGQRMGKISVGRKERQERVREGGRQSKGTNCDRERPQLSTF